MNLEADTSVSEENDSSQIENINLDTIFDLISLHMVIKKKCRYFGKIMTQNAVFNICKSVCTFTKKKLNMRKWDRFIHSQNSLGENILIYCIRKEYDNYFIQFIIQELDMNLEEKYNHRTALSYAVEMKNYHITKILIDANASIDNTDSKGNSLFHYLFSVIPATDSLIVNDISKNAFLTCQELLKTNIDLLSFDINLKKPLEYAMDMKNLDSVFTMFRDEHLIDINLCLRALSLFFENQLPMIKSLFMNYTNIILKLIKSFGSSFILRVKKIKEPITIMSFFIICKEKAIADIIFQNGFNINLLNEDLKSYPYYSKNYVSRNYFKCEINYYHKLKQVFYLIHLRKYLRFGRRYTFNIKRYFNKNSNDFSLHISKIKDDKSKDMSSVNQYTFDQQYLQEVSEYLYENAYLIDHLENKYIYFYQILINFNLFKKIISFI